jgi:hypothetical protein
VTEQTQVLDASIEKNRQVTLITPARPGDDYQEECRLRVRELAPDRFLLLESNSFIFSDFLLLWGDEVVVRKESDGIYSVVEVVTPSAMAHDFSVGGSPQGDTEFTRTLHELGGEWECDMGGLTMVHFPYCHQEELKQRTGMRLAANTVGGHRTDLDPI